MKNLSLILKENGLKSTPQRLAVLDYFADNKQHPSADMVVESIKKKHPHIAIGTVYNILECFEEKGIIKKINTKEDKMRYDAFIDKHHHIFDLETNQIIDYYDENLDQILEDYFKSKNLEHIKIENIRLEIQAKVNKI